jgi:hypothetical protein
MENIIEDVLLSAVVELSQDMKDALHRAYQEVLRGNITFRSYVAYRCSQ